MTTSEFAFLQLVRSGGVKNFRTLSKDDNTLLVICLENHWVARYRDGSVRLEPKGVSALAAEEERIANEAEQHAKQQHDKESQQELANKRYRNDVRRSWAQLLVNSIVGLVSLLAGTFLGAYLSQCTSWLDWLKALFR